MKARLTCLDLAFSCGMLLAAGCHVGSHLAGDATDDGDAEAPETDAAENGDEDAAEDGEEGGDGDLPGDDVPGFCGDGALDPGEECDDGPENSDTAPDACREDCTFPRCGDGARDSIEECDGEGLEGITCEDFGIIFPIGEPSCESCLIMPGTCESTCGNGMMDAGEACDDGNAAEADGCTECRIADILVDRDEYDFQGAPAIDMSPDGRFVISWSWNGDAGWDIYARVFDRNGDPAGEAFPVNTMTDGEQDSSSVAMADDGRFVVAWDSDTGDGSGSGVFARLFDASGGALGDEFQVNTWTSDDQLAPRVSSSSDGMFVVVWRSNGEDGADGGIFGQCYGVDGTASGAEFQVNVYSASNEIEPDVAMAPGGGFVAAWSGNHGMTYEYVWARRFDADCLPMGDEALVNAIMSGNQISVSVAMVSDTRTIAAWVTGDSIYGQASDPPGTPLGILFQASDTILYEQQRPRIEAAPGGGFIVAWTSDGRDGDGWGAFGRLFGADLVPLGPDIQLNTFTSGGQANPGVAMDGSGRFVAVWVGRWTDELGLRDYRLVSYQRFDAAGNARGSLPW